MKSDIDIKDDIYNFIKCCGLDEIVSGTLCKRGVRPKDSDKEDIVINVLANENGQTQEAFVNVNVYVEDIMVDGQYEEDTIRLRELCKPFGERLNVGGGETFRFTLKSQKVLAVTDAHVHVINNKIYYKQIND